MRNKAQEYRDATNKILKQFNEENKTYFEELRSYLLISSLLYDETSMNEQIYSIVQDLLEAQKKRRICDKFLWQSTKVNS